MSKIRHLKKAVQILRDKFDHEIWEELYWTWNLKNWTIQFTNEDDYQSIVAYRAVDGLTNWSDYITLEARRREWRELIA